MEQQPVVAASLLISALLGGEKNALRRGRLAKTTSSRRCGRRTASPTEVGKQSWLPSSRARPPRPDVGAMCAVPRAHVRDPGGRRPAALSGTPWRLPIDCRRPGPPSASPSGLLERQVFLPQVTDLCKRLRQCLAGKYFRSGGIDLRFGDGPSIETFPHGTCRVRTPGSVTH